MPLVIAANPDAATQVIAVGGVAYAAVGGGLAGYDMLTGDGLQVLSLAAGKITALARDGTLIYAMDDANTLHVVDISQPRMVLRGSVTVAAGAKLAGGSGALFVGGGVAYIAVTRFVNTSGLGAVSGYITVDVSNPDQPQALSGEPSSDAAGTAVAVNGSGTALTVGSDLNGPAMDVFDSTDPTNVAQFFTRYTLPAAANDVAIGAGIAFVADGASGLQVVNYLPFDTKGVPPTIKLDTSNLTPDPTLGGFDAVEGSLLTLKATVSDDVQVRNVELLVNGQVVKNDVSFPFDLSTFLPTIAAAGNSVTVEVSATDTGGNTSATSPITFHLARDTTPPQIVQTFPAAGETVGQQLRTVAIDFSKPIDPATVTASSIVVTGPGVSLTPQNIEFRFNDAEVQLTYPAATLPVGAYQLLIHAASITDLPGNPLGSADVAVPFTVASNTDVWINPAGGDWSVASNWAGGQVPKDGDDVLIDVPGSSPTITYSGASGATALHSLVSKDPFVMAGGTLSATQSIEVDSSFTMTGGTIKNTLILRGAGGQGLTVTGEGTGIGPGTLDGVTLDADLNFAQPTGFGPSILKVVNGLTFNGTANLGTNNELLLSGTQTLSGTGTFTFGVPATYLQSPSSVSVAGQLVIGPGITIHAQQGVLDSFSGSSITNQGTIAVDGAAAGGQMDIQSSLTSSFTNQGKLIAVNGGTLKLEGTWSNAANGSISADASTLDLGAIGDKQTWTNAGTISAVNASTVNLGGTFTFAGLGNFSRTGSTVNLTGTLDNTNTTLALNSATGLWNVRGRINGGSYTSADGAQLFFFNAAILDGVTINGDIHVDANGGVEILDNLTLNATAFLGDPAGTFAGSIFLIDSVQTLGGNGTVVLGRNSNQLDNGIISQPGSALTIGSGITVRGEAGQIAGNVLNLGTVAADTAGGVITISSTSFTNQGTLRASGGGVLNVAGLVLPTTGTITAGAGGTVAVTGDLSLSSASTVNVELGGTDPSLFGQIDVNGASASGGTLGAATLNGTLNISLVNGYQPVSGDSFKVMTFGSETGQFATINGTNLPNNLVLAPKYDAGDLTLVVGAAQLADVRPMATATDGALPSLQASPAATRSILQAAIAQWAAAGLDPRLAGLLKSVDISLEHLGNDVLALTAGNRIILSNDADGYGWFIDPDPTGNADFRPTSNGHVLAALAGTPAAGRFDLLTVMEHEIGHLLGLPDQPSGVDLMAEHLAGGVRRTPSAEDVDAIFADSGDVSP